MGDLALGPLKYMFFPLEFTNLGFTKLNFSLFYKGRQSSTPTKGTAAIRNGKVVLISRRHPHSSLIQVPSSVFLYASRLHDCYAQTNGRTLLELVVRNTTHPLLCASNRARVL